MISYITNWLSDPLTWFLALLVALPGRLLAISAHESAHAWVADRCGDPTARQLGRISLNPMRHLDPMGAIFMVLVGVGWAKPVPVNPRNFKNPRRSDILVSVAGVTANLILFLLGCVALYSWAAAVLHGLGHVPMAQLREGVAALTTYTDGTPCYFDGDALYALSGVLSNAPYLSKALIAPISGGVMGTLYQMLSYFVQTNLVLAVFNLIPMPPLDGYHVLNDLILKKSLYASPRVAQISTGVMFVLLFTGILGRGLSIVVDWVFSGAGRAAMAIFSALGGF